jgi:membrane peptidoglycan carboxypeptidase
VTVYESSDLIKKKQRGKIRGFIFRSTRHIVVFALLSALLLGTLGFLGYGFIQVAAATIPLPEAKPLGEVSTIYDHNGKQIGVIPGSENRIILADDKIPQVMKDAIVAAEDREFYTSGGVSYKAIALAQARYLLTRKVQGGSGITQQYVKNAYLTPDRTAKRKLNELIIASKLAKTNSKDHILALYLNTVYFGRNAYGLEAASRAYFGHSATKLSTPEAATLAAMVKAPSVYAMARVDKTVAAKLHDRRTYVLNGMVVMHTLRCDPKYKPVADNCLSRYNAAPIGFIPGRENSGPVSAQPYIATQVSEYIKQAFNDDGSGNTGAALLARGGLKITTTIDKGLQNATDQSVANRRPAPDVSVGVTSMDYTTGAVRALYGGANYANDQFNYATMAHRQVGSTMKPLVLAAGLQYGTGDNGQGISPQSRFPAPACVWAKNGKVYLPGSGVSDGEKICNDDFADHGVLTEQQALVQSNNPVHMQLIEAVTPQATIKMARQLGINDGLLPGSRPATMPNVLDLALGAGEYTSVQLNSAYSTIANEGVHNRPYLIQTITGPDGAMLYDHDQDPNYQSNGTDLSADNARKLTKVMTGVLSSPEGTGYRWARVPGRPLAGKTGTTDKDAVMTGFMPKGYNMPLATTVTIGFKDNRDLHIQGHWVFGGNASGLIFHDVMQYAMGDQPVQHFPGADITDGAIIGVTAPPSPSDIPSEPVAPSDSPSPSEQPPLIQLPDLFPSSTPDESVSPSDTAPPTTQPDATGPPTESAGPPDANGGAQPVAPSPSDSTIHD